MYEKNVRKRSRLKAGQASKTVAKPGLTRNTVMLCVWWDWNALPIPPHTIYYELLPPDRTIDSELYCEQLMRLKQEVERKRPELINRRGVVFIMITLDLTH
ncbi:jg7061 [Pararge aegeria aegeria]|uniref:Jg7061 protein n=1 Tax=Pararge aegeria aegeria TaxID=348720 RepID=A0A8S4RHP1_9NEOP|nr:jg7061 [Pararge aegeria aegeria]